MISIATPSRRDSARISSRICAWIVTSSAVVGSSARISEGLQASAMAIIMRWRRRHLEVDLEALGELPSDRKYRVERGHGLLEHHGDFAPAHLLHLGFGELEQIAPLVEDLARFDAPGRFGNETHDGER